jgi:O-methyltransferase
MIGKKVRNLFQTLQLARRLDGHPHLANLVNQALQSEEQIDADSTYNQRFHALNRLASHWGFEIYNHHVSWMLDQQFWDLWKEFPLAGQRPDRKFVLWSLANSIKKFAGDTAECGVLYGHSTHLICSALKTAANHDHHAFDSFEGLSKPQSEDALLSSAAYTWEKGDLAVNLEMAQANLRQFTNIKYYKGWIPNRFSEVMDRKFVLVHIDVDLFQPTLDSARFFAERLVTGGIIVCDDYGFETCPGARRAFDIVSDETEMPIIHLPTGQGIMIRH